MKVKALSLLIVDKDQTMRQVLASIVSDRYRSVTAAAPEEVGRLLALESFDMMIAPRIRANSPEEEDGDSRAAERATGFAVIRSGVTGKIYEFRSINQEASSCVTSRFERALLQVAIENSEFFLRQIKRIKENDAVF
ncbi:MAG: hypothetical protein ND866_27540 [Pyrinomonadaceae bacterium]|nr:hypothetical protein [Pyrinomonadaceae bacterium]